MEEGFEGLLRDKTRPSRIEPLDADVAKRVVAMTLTDPPVKPRTDRRHDGGGDWHQRSSYRRIWRGHGLQPHRVAIKL